MVSDQSGGDDLGAVEVEPRAGGSDLTAADDLRSRMRLRLAMNQPAHRAAAPPTENGQQPESPTLPVSGRPTISSLAGLPNRGGPNEISQLVWNSVLESLHTGMTTAATPPADPVEDAPPSDGDAPAVAAVPQANGEALQAPVIPVLEQPSAAQRPAFQPQPLYAAGDLDQQGIADLFAPAQTSLAELVANPAPAPHVVPQPSSLYDLPSGERQIHVPVATPPSIPVVVVPSNTGAVTQVSGYTGVIVPSIPVLSQPSRLSAAPPRPAPNRIGEPLVMPTVQGKAKKKKRHPFRALFSMLIVLGLIGGAAYAGWYFLIRKKVTWPADTAPLATFVEQTVHRDFTEKVPMVTMSVPEYEVKLGIELESRMYPDADGQLNALRAVGVAGPTQSPSVIGHWAASVITSFYRPEDQTIYRIEGDTSAFQVSLLRSLTLALADQQLEWAKALPTMTPAQRTGYLAGLDGVAATVVAAKFVAVPELASQASAEEQLRATSAGITDAGLPVALQLVLASVENGAPRHPQPPVTDPLKDLLAPQTDIAAFDPAKSPTTVPVTTGGALATTATPQALGMQFWYEAMVPAIGPAAARTAALAYAGDASSVTVTDGHPCISASLSVASEADAATLQTGLQALVASRPPASNATITFADNVFTVAMCEAPDAANDQLATADAAVLYTAAQREASVAGDLIAIGLPTTDAAWQCAVSAVRGGALDGYTRGSTDPDVIAKLNNVVTLCRAASAAPPAAPTATVAPAVTVAPVAPVVTAAG